MSFTLFFVIIEPRRIKRLEWKEEHLLVLQVQVLQDLNSIPPPQYKEFSVSIEKTRNENTDVYNWAFQHLRDKHSNISMNWDTANDLAEEINKKLKEFENDIHPTIIKSIGETYLSGLSKFIWLMIKNRIHNEIKDIDDVRIAGTSISITITPTKFSFIEFNKPLNNAIQPNNNRWDRLYRRMLFTFRKAMYYYQECFNKVPRSRSR
jgi:hypothetical protein